MTREQAQLAIDNGATGCTQNPAYTWKMMTNEKESSYVEEVLKNILKDTQDTDQAMVALQRELIGGVAKVFKPMYDASNGKYGYVSIQGDPFREDAKSIIEFARFNRQAGENIMAKIPAVPGGLEAMETLIKERVPINATECFAVRQVMDVIELYEKTTKNMVNPAPMYYSVITGIFDEYITGQVEKEGIDIPSDYVWQGGIAVAKKIYQMVKESGSECKFIGGGARGLHHFTEMVGADCQITINWSGTADKLLEQDAPVVQRFLAPTPHRVVDELCEKIPAFRQAYEWKAIDPSEYEDYGPVVLFRSSFESAWKNALKWIEERK